MCFRASSSSCVNGEQERWSQLGDGARRPSDARQASPASGPYLRAAPQQQGPQAAAAAHQRLHAVLGDLVTPRQVEVLQVLAALAGRTGNSHACAAHPMGSAGTSLSSETRKQFPGERPPGPKSPTSCRRGTTRKVSNTRMLEPWILLVTATDRHSYLIPFKELFVMDTQEVRSRCFSLEQNRLRL